MRAKTTHEEYLNRTIGAKYSAITKFIGHDSQIKLKCKTCGFEWWSSGTNAIRNKAGCRNCAGKKMSARMTKKMKNTSVST